MASALMIASTQLSSLLGLSVSSSTYVWRTWFDIGKNIPKANPFAFLMGAIGMTLLVLWGIDTRRQRRGRKRTRGIERRKRQRGRKDVVAKRIGNFCCGL